MEESNHFTCLSYDNIDFLIQSKYVLFGIFLQSFKAEKNISFENEVLPHIYIGSFLEKHFQCRPVEDCNVMLVMKKSDFDKPLQKLIVEYTETKFPPSGNFALSVNTAISSRIMDTSILRLMPEGIRPKQSDCGVSAIGFIEEPKSQNCRKQILLSTDCLLRTLIKEGGQANG